MYVETEVDIRVLVQHRLTVYNARLPSDAPKKKKRFGNGCRPPKSAFPHRSEKNHDQMLLQLPSNPQLLCLFLIVLLVHNRGLFPQNPPPQSVSQSAQKYSVDDFAQQRALFT